jgi:cystine transport system ATP-binding protein
MKDLVMKDHDGRCHHEMRFAKDVADEVIFMDQGKIIERSKPNEMFSQPKEERTRQFLNLIQVH